MSIYIYISHSGDLSKAARNILKGLQEVPMQTNRHLKNMVVLYRTVVGEENEERTIGLNIGVGGR